MYRPFMMSTLSTRADQALLEAAVESGLGYAVTLTTKGRSTVCGIGLHSAARAACNEIIGAELIEYSPVTGAWEYVAKAA